MPCGLKEGHPYTSLHHVHEFVSPDHPAHMEKPRRLNANIALGVCSGLERGHRIFLGDYLGCSPCDEFKPLLWIHDQRLMMFGRPPCSPMLTPDLMKGCFILLGRALYNGTYP